MLLIEALAGVIGESEGSERGSLLGAVAGDDVRQARPTDHLGVLRHYLHLGSLGEVEHLGERGSIRLVQLELCLGVLA